jgi:cold shock CspA family protein
MEATVLFKKKTGNGGYLLVRIGRDKALVHQEDADFVIEDAHKGDLIDVEVEDTPRGLRATRASFKARVDGQAAYEFAGSVVAVRRDHVFVAPGDGGRDVFCHLADFIDYQDGRSRMFEYLDGGSRVSGYWRQTARGRRGMQLTA